MARYPNFLKYSVEQSLCAKKKLKPFSHFDRIPDCVRQTDTQTSAHS